jgi:hypothetical protein
MRTCCAGEMASASASRRPALFIRYPPVTKSWRGALLRAIEGFQGRAGGPSAAGTRNGGEGGLLGRKPIPGKWDLPPPETEWSPYPKELPHASSKPNGLAAYRPYPRKSTHANSTEGRPLGLPISAKHRSSKISSRPFSVSWYSSCPRFSSEERWRFEVGSRPSRIVGSRLASRALCEGGSSSQPLDVPYRRYSQPGVTVTVTLQFTEVVGDVTSWSWLGLLPR